MKTRLEMIIKILTKKKVVLLTEEGEGIYQITFVGTDVPVNAIKKIWLP